MTTKKTTYLSPRTKFVPIANEECLLQSTSGQIIDDNDDDDDWEWDDDGGQ